MTTAGRPEHGDTKVSSPPARDEVHLVARGIATAVAPADGLTAVQAALLRAVTNALTGFQIDYSSLEALGPEELSEVLRPRDQDYRQRIVHHMVLGELVLRPLPAEVALRVARYAEALGIRDSFVRIARRYAQGATGLAWLDLQRSGFVEEVRAADYDASSPDRSDGDRSPSDPFAPAEVDPHLEERWRSYEELPEGTLGRSAWTMYDGRGFRLPGAPGGAPRYLAQHDYVHVLADYGTNLRGELEVFAFIGRADPDPKGFAWLATLIGLFETGYIAETGFFERDVRERTLQAPGMDMRIADAIRRGKVVCGQYGVDLFEVDYHALASRSLDEVRELLHLPAKPEVAEQAGWPGAFDRAGMSEIQQHFADARGGRAE